LEARRNQVFILKWKPCYFFCLNFFRKKMTRGSFLINKHTERLVRSGKGPTRAPDRSESRIKKKREKKEGNNTEKVTDESRK